MIKQTLELRNKLLHRLNDQNFHSGQVLATQFSVSRTAISNHIKSLVELGVDVFSVKGKGYKLGRYYDLLNADHIQDSLTHSSPKPIIIKSVVDSTNDIVKSMLDNTENGTCCLAEAQTAGRGRRGRKWVSPFGSSIYLSMHWRFKDGYQSITGLSLLIGICVHQALAEIGVQNAKLKWPNDVYINNKKVAGILVEVEGQVDSEVSAVIGIGINLNLPETIESIEQAFTDVAREIEGTLDRNALCARLIDKLWGHLCVFEQEGLQPFIKYWHKHDQFIEKSVRLITGEKHVEGVCKGIDSGGALLLANNAGVIKPYYGGEISVRAL